MSADIDKEQEPVSLDLIAQTLSKAEYLVFDMKGQLAVVYDRNALEDHEEQRIRRIYQFKDGKFYRVDFKGITKQITDLIVTKIKVRDLAEEVVKTTSPEVLLESFKRLQHPKIRAKVKAETGGCYELLIPGTKGQQPVSLFLRRS